MNEEDWVSIEQYDCILKENEHLRDALSFYATDEAPDGWVAIHALRFAGTSDYIFQGSVVEKHNEMV